MKGKIALTVGFVLCELALVAVPFVPGLRDILPATPGPREQLEWQLTVIGIEFSLVTAFIGLWFLLQERDQKAFEADLRKLLPTTRVTQLRDDTFYSNFLAAAKNASSRVCIMYLAPYAPDYTKHEDRLQYYRDVLSLIKKRSNVRFRRIMRTTPRTNEWIAELAVHLTECPNADLAILKEQEKEDMPLALSVQIIDDDQVWLVALASHERRGNFRDIHIESVEVAQGLAQYYDRLWTRATPIVDSGRLTEEGEKFVRQFSHAK